MLFRMHFTSNSWLPEVLQLLIGIYLPANKKFCDSYPQKNKFLIIVLSNSQVLTRLRLWPKLQEERKSRNSHELSRKSTQPRQHSDGIKREYRSLFFSTQSYDIDALFEFNPPPQGPFSTENCWIEFGTDQLLTDMLTCLLSSCLFLDFSQPY